MFYLILLTLSLYKDQFYQVRVYLLKAQYSQTCIQRPPLGPEKCGRYAEGCLKKISGK
jgi:hypothetical protein